MVLRLFMPQRLHKYLMDTSFITIHYPILIYIHLSYEFYHYYSLYVNSKINYTIATYYM